MHQRKKYFSLSRKRVSIFLLTGNHGLKPVSHTIYPPLEVFNIFALYRNTQSVISREIPTVKRKNVQTGFSPGSMSFDIDEKRNERLSYLIGYVENCDKPKFLTL